MTFNFQNFTGFCSAIFERTSCGVVILDVAGRPLFRNEATKAILGAVPILHLDRTGRVQSRYQELSDAMRMLNSKPRRDQTVEVVRVDLEGSPVIAVWLFPLADHIDNGALDEVSTPHLMLKLVRNDASVVSSELLSRVLQITRAEGRIVQQLLSGNNLKQYAITTNLSYNTVRNQLRSVMAKTGARSQTELIAMTHRLLAPLAWARDESLTVRQS